MYKSWMEPLRGKNMSSEPPTVVGFKDFWTDIGRMLV